MLGPDLNGKGVVAKVKSEMSVVGEANSNGDGGGSWGTKSGINKRLEKKDVGTNGSGGGRKDATVKQKMNKTEKENEDAEGAVENALWNDMLAERAVRGSD
ncbi:uncharacterized protein MONOS_13457 [Monocercomonoides exilis]|uniref:uncharacterized protein n=1 Tax=Monocercomonoides exilis TaxID=2049356 RepID=UPI00355A4040|nr:hypothetical protein MONOS_13457 [Monocercomonoides exilis]|eukprot:MONOS_13457.1-p1 / transcript=MONOS_13457.1 / gene=MONOS_13457 / organism=Monocercomonoides_exilis_PA203 / gene_product=unspecified product / transcript_product=unspecified product / location=Mono_scaffold00831:16599-16901(-) / protein_length=101 / sequence_SO=supercontig / SO=protein_coding / is_pseudo=false